MIRVIYMQRFKMFIQSSSLTKLGTPVRHYRGDLPCEGEGRGRGKELSVTAHK